LAVFETLSMLHLTRLTPGKHFIDGFQLREWIIGLVIIAAIWIFAHAMVFLTSLLVKKSGNGIVAIIIMPLAIILLLPGTMAITMFFVKVNAVLTWYIAFTRLTLIILYCLFIGFGVYLWVRRIALGKRILKPLIVALTLTLTVPWILYVSAYLYFSLSFNSAIREAHAAGLETDVNKVILPPVPTEQNAAPGILKFHNEYKPVYKLYSAKNQEDGNVLGPLPSQCKSGLSWANTNFSFSGVIHENIPQESILKVADFIMKDPRMNQCYSILSKALEKPYCRLRKNYTTMECYDLEFNVIRAASFLSDRAYALRVYGQDDDFFACLAGIDKLGEALTEQPYEMLKREGLWLKAKEYKTAIAAGPDTPEAVKSYNQMIRDIDSINPTMPDEIFRIYSYVKGEDRFFSPLSFASYDFSLERNLLFLPRKLQSAITWLRWKILADKLLKKALTSASIKEMEATLDSFRKSVGEKPGFFITNVYSYFGFRAEFETYKICLALKVYNINHGRFPDSLQQLVPEILPRIPINPQTGKEYIYQAEADGFLLSPHPNNRGIKYKTWKIEAEKAK
ncbi:MAG: hypothetical protein WCP55_18295, partial [Lentisphaerota bacterium]